MLSKMKNEYVDTLHFSLNGVSIFAYAFYQSGGWLRIFGRGVSWTNRPGFSIRYGYKKSLKISKFYFVII